MLNYSEKELAIQATKMRLRTWEMIYKSGTGHTGGDFSIADILSVLYFNVLNVDPADSANPDRDI